MLGKRLINSNSAAAGGSCTTDNNNYPSANLAYYKMSDATDETGSYDGTPTDVNFNVAGKFGNAGSFNGSSSKISLGTIGFGATSQITISMWLKPNSSQVAYSQIIDRSHNTLGGWAIQQSNTSTNQYHFALQEGSPFKVSSTISLTASVWSHLVFTINASGNLNAYLNNVQVITSDTGYGSLNNSLNLETIISGYSGTTGRNFNGSIDQVRIFPTALSASQVSQLYNEVYCVPTIVPTDYFNPVIYTGNSSVQSISLGFAPDMVWVKKRNSATSGDHMIMDTIRGIGSGGGANILYPSYAQGQATNADSAYFRSFDANGFTVGSNTYFNATNNTYVAWNWKAGGAAVSNTDGNNTTAMVSANSESGFSIIKFTGNGNNGGSVGHGLNAVPELWIWKRTSSSSSWVVASTFVNNWQGYLELNGSGSTAVDTAMLAPDSSKIKFPLGSPTFNGSNQDAIIYAFHSVEGMSKIGSYVGTAATDNPIVTGFRPSFVMVKGSSNSGSWIIYDNKRNTTNPRNTVLYADSSAAESTNTNLNIDFNSNGFVLTGADTDFNGLNRTYIYLAIAEEVAPHGVESEYAVDANSTTITFANDHIYSTYNGTSGIIKYNVDGSQDSSFTTPYSNMTSIADNRAGTVLYARMTNNRVRYFNYSGSYLGGLFNDTTGNDHTFFDGTTLWTGGSGSTVHGRNIAASTDTSFSLSTYTFNEGCYVTSTQKIWMVDGNGFREYTPVLTSGVITSFQASAAALVDAFGTAAISITYDYTNDLIYTLETSMDGTRRFIKRNKDMSYYTS